MAHPNELGAPPNALATPGAIEFLRAWAVDGGLQVSLIPQAWPTPEAWGIVFADLLRHILDAYQKSEGRDPNETGQAIVDMFVAEISGPTDTPTGEFQS